jgi:hypothetical protein
VVLPRPPKSSCREVDVALFQWLNQKQAERTSDSGSMCTESQLFHEAVGLEGEFSASVGWPARFRQPRDICEIAVQRERERDFEPVLLRLDTICRVSCVWSFVNPVTLLHRRGSFLHV